MPANAFVRSRASTATLATSTLDPRAAPPTSDPSHLGQIRGRTCEHFTETHRFRLRLRRVRVAVVTQGRSESIPTLARLRSRHRRIRGAHLLQRCRRPLKTYRRTPTLNPRDSPSARVGVPVGVPTPPDARSTADPRIFFSDAGEHASMSSNAPRDPRARVRLRRLDASTGTRWASSHARATPPATRAVRATP